MIQVAWGVVACRYGVISEKAWIYSYCSYFLRRLTFFSVTFALQPPFLIFACICFHHYQSVTSCTLATFALYFFWICFIRHICAVWSNYLLYVYFEVESHLKTSQFYCNKVWSFPTLTLPLTCNHIASKINRNKVFNFTLYFALSVIQIKLL